MPFVLPLTDQDAENTRLLDRLTKQQEENQSLRVENAQLKSENESLKVELKMDRGTRKAVIEALGGNEADCFQPYPDDIKLRDITGSIESLKAQVQSLRAENAKLKEQLDNETSTEGLDELVIHKQKEQIEKLKEEIKGLRADINLYTNGMSLEEWHDDMEQQKAEITDDAERDIAQLEAQIEKLKQHQSDTDRELRYYIDYITGHGNGWQEFAEALSHEIKGKDITINWSWLEDDFNLFSVVYYYPDPITGEPIETKTTMIRDKNEIDDIDAGPTPEELEEHKEFFSDCVLGATIKSIEYIKVYDFSDSPREPTEVEKLKAEVDKLKAELLDINAKHHRDTQKTCLKAKFDTWREEQVKYNSDYNMEDEAQWLVYEAGNIQDAIEVFNELYEDGTGDDYTWKLECDHERNWELDQWWMDEETGEYTLTEAEWEAQNQ